MRPYTIIISAWEQRGGRGYRLCYCTMSQDVMGVCSHGKGKKIFLLCVLLTVLCYGCLNRSGPTFPSAAQVVFVRLGVCTGRHR